MEKCILAGLTTESADSYDELEKLAKTASILIIDKVVQNRRLPDPAYFVGYGKALEIKKCCELNKVNTVIFNNNLRANQQRNLEKITGLKIIDRSTLILDIFAQHARTNEGKLQVELAQLTYFLPRLSGRGKEYSQLGGGIGTRGPGEKKLEVDRRRIRDRIIFLNKKVDEIKQHRRVMRQNRTSKKLMSVSLVGYTNAGKSTLLNTLTKSNVLVEDKLFSTLDPTTRKIRLPDGKIILITDTVGFIRDLPAELILAFRATLEEIEFSDIIITVIDSSSSNMDVQMSAIYRELKELNVLKKPILTCLNKIDAINDKKLQNLQNSFPDSIPISAISGKNIDFLLSKISLIYNELLTNS